MRPPVAVNYRGEPRRIGVEIELSGLDLGTLSRIVTNVFGGEVSPISAYECNVVGTHLGNFRVELDFQYLKDLGRDNVPRDGIADDLMRLSQDALAEIARQVVPFEIVTPPIALDRLPLVDDLVLALRDHGGRGTRHSPVYAFGLHLNPEVPSLDTAVLVRYLRAFLCLYDWLVDVEQVDWSRRMTPYVNAFPSEYVRILLASSYAPSRDRFIADYLHFNADRNRALDMLPLLAFLDPRRVRASISDPRISARPTFHYRLPNCDVDVAGWGVSTPWTNWLQVELLAEDPQRLDDISNAYATHLNDGFAQLLNDWSSLSQRWLV